MLKIKILNLLEILNPAFLNSGSCRHHQAWLSLPNPPGSLATLPRTPCQPSGAISPCPSDQDWSPTPAVLPCLVTGATEQGTPAGPCPTLSSVPVPREVPSSWAWGCPGAPSSSGAVGQAPAARPCPDKPPRFPLTLPAHSPQGAISCAEPKHNSLLAKFSPY